MNPRESFNLTEDRCVSLFVLYYGCGFSSSPPIAPSLLSSRLPFLADEREISNCGVWAWMGETHTHVGGLFGSACVPLVQVRATISELGPRYRGLGNYEKVAVR